MPYGDLVAQKVQRFATVEDLAKHKCTIEEMEEYEPHVVRGNVIYAGVDYEAILREAEKEADVVYCGMAETTILLFTSPT
jgi:predicted GTPase